MGSVYREQFRRAMYGNRPTWTCLVCRVAFPILDRPRTLCDGCIDATALKPGETWTPTTEWGRQRQAERAARSHSPASSTPAER